MDLPIRLRHDDAHCAGTDSRDNLPAGIAQAEHLRSLASSRAGALARYSGAPGESPTVGPQRGDLAPTDSNAVAPGVETTGLLLQRVDAFSAAYEALVRVRGVVERGCVHATDVGTNSGPCKAVDFPRSSDSAARVPMSIARDADATEGGR